LWRKKATTKDIIHADDLFGAWKNSPESMHAFTMCMQNLFREQAGSLVSSYDFSKHKTLVDVGGGQGSITKEIMRVFGAKNFKNSSLEKAIVMDLAEVVKYATSTDDNPIKFVAGNFFEPETIPTGDLLLLNGVIHDWNDNDSVKIIKNTASKLSPGGTLLIMDMAVDPNSQFYNTITLIDVYMTTVLNGPFRTHEEYEAIIREAGMELVEIRNTRSSMSVYVAKLPKK